jgi:hypothetical protein
MRRLFQVELIINYPKQIPFLGKDAINWMVRNGFSKTREQALELGTNQDIILPETGNTTESLGNLAMSQGYYYHITRYKFKLMSTSDIKPNPEITVLMMENIIIRLTYAF